MSVKRMHFNVINLCKNFIGLQRLTTVQNKTIDCDVFLYEMLLTIVNHC